ncbi:MAG: DUF6062 family protein [Anaerolineae bacterium]
MAPKPGKHTPFFELVDAQKLTGCPVCRLVYKATDRYLDGLLYEAVLDPEVRAKLKGSRGFCSEHVEMLSRRSGRALGVALIYRDIIRTVAVRAEQGHAQRPATLLNRLLGRPDNTAGSSGGIVAEIECPACTIAQGAEKTNLEILIAHIDDERLYTAYAQGEGLCLEHFRLALEAAPDMATYERIMQPQVARYHIMLRDLDEFIRKHDHRFSHETMGEEGDVWLRAMNAVVGGAGRGLSARTGGRRTFDMVDEHR